MDRNRQRLEKVNQQLGNIDDSILSPAVKELIRDSALHYAQWLEREDQLDALGLSVDYGGACEYPNDDGEAVGVVEIDGIKLGTIRIERER